MRNLFIIPILCVITLIAGCSKQEPNMDQAVNPIIGDKSFVEKYGNMPGAETNEDLRIRTHFEYVEAFLKGKDVLHLSPELRNRRAQILALLSEYRANGIFPRNYDHPDKRVPCFIDKDGRICAVGYLIEQTAGREMAEQINKKYKYEAILAMNDKQIDNWVAGTGLTKEEFAMIQPTYGPVTDYNYISKGYGISSAAMGGANLSLSVINGMQNIKGTGNRTASILGLISGAGQVTLGILHFPPVENVWGSTITNLGQRNLSMTNIGIGTGTMVLSAWNLLSNKTKKDRYVAWNVYSFPAPENQLGVGLSLSKNF